MLVGGLFGGGLFSINAEMGDKRAEKISYTFFVLACIGVALMVRPLIVELHKPYYQYKIEAHYINGDVVNYLIEAKSDPCITSSRGSYTLHCGGEHIQGVCRFRIISKRQINQSTN